jgi:hypothetical protein
MTKLELLGAAVIVVVAAGVVGLQAWSLLRPSRVPERLTEAELEELFRSPDLESFARLRGNNLVAVSRTEHLQMHEPRCNPAFVWPEGTLPLTAPLPEEVVRGAFRRHLEAGEPWRDR